jgi:hypothetical protein
VFDELCDWEGKGGYDNWRDGEFKAVMEHELTFELVARTTDLQGTTRVI